MEAKTRFAYLVDGIVPPPETTSRLKGLDLLITESTMDSLDVEWKNFQLDDAVEFWNKTGIPKCVFTHLSCHRWKEGQLVAGLTTSERSDFEKAHPGLIFAYDGMRIRL